ncbi:MAG: hypothetical protein FWH22_11720, partial [Fibromonadales bacterium]|nr:hypothetical protein [Fibromonadales bacterium]
IPAHLVKRLYMGFLNLAGIFEIDRIFWKIILKILEILANSDSDKKQRNSAMRKVPNKQQENQK